jgi:aspartyl aminopeptidase
MANNKPIDFKQHIPLAKKACEFFDQSTDPFLAVKTCSDALEAAGFVKLSKREPMEGKLVPGEYYMYYRGGNWSGTLKLERHLN